MQDEFKSFVKTKPELADYVSSGEMTWQKFYELYDLYGKDNSIWDKYIKKDRSSISKITDLVKNIDTDSIKSNIDTAQKAIDFVADLTKKDVGTKSFSSGPVSPRPLNKFFED